MADEPEDTPDMEALFTQWAEKRDAERAKETRRKKLGPDMVEFADFILDRAEERAAARRKAADEEEEDDEPDRGGGKGSLADRWFGKTGT